MRTYKSVNEYLKEAKYGDRFVLAGYGILDGLNANSKHETYIFKGLNNHNNMKLKEYRGKTNYLLSADRYDQQVQVLTKKEFKELPVLW